MNKVFAAMVVGVVVVGAYYYYHLYLLHQPHHPSTVPHSLAEYRATHFVPPVPQPLPPPLTDAQKGNVPVRDGTVGAKEYKNTQFHFSILYPKDLLVAENIDQYGALTVTFENDNKDDLKGFQVYVQPYNLSEVTEERFKKDLPSGVRTNVTNTTIAGATAAAFYSTDPNLGVTREVWFLKGGLLYEVTTLKPLDTWLDSILKTWQFVQ